MEKYPKQNQISKTEAAVSRRRFLWGAGAVAAAAAVGTAIYKKFEGDDEVEVLENERFDNESKGFMAAFLIGPNEILFVDENNVPIGKPVDFSKAIPEELKVEGLAISPPPLSWRREMAATIEADPANTPRKVARSYNVALDFKAALLNGEPTLVAKIKAGEVNSVLDIANHFGEKSVRGVEKNISRKDYVKEALTLSERVPAVVRDELQIELRKVMPGLCAQESRFNNDITSRSGARGIFQFMPDVWDSYGKDDNDINSLKTQTEVAGLMFSDIYRQLMHHCDQEALLVARDLFSSQSDFLKHLIVPLLINSYNAGSKRLADVVNEFFTPKRNLDGLSGKDIYLAMANYAHENEEGTMEKYGTDAREYVSKVYALSQIL
jgi:hypothetical protein